MLGELSHLTLMVNQMGEIGRLKKLKPREAWSHEALDFTPWLLENAHVLGEALGMELELFEAEHSVGGFSLDLIGEDLNSKEIVIIENQLEASDHSHLGQILTYAGGTNAVNVVWIAETFRSEHRAALNWLNERTDEGTRFFAVELSAVQIGDSLLAPLFSVVVEPNDWQKTVRRSTQVPNLSANRELKHEFWLQFLDQLHLRFPNWTNTRKSLPQNWMNLPAGVSVANYAVVISGSTIRVEIYFSSSDATINLANFEKVFAQRVAIERVFGVPLDWDELPGRKACRISFSAPANVNNRDDWDTHLNWLLDNIGRLRAAVDSVGGLPKLFRDVGKHGG